MQTACVLGVWPVNYLHVVSGSHIPKYIVMHRSCDPFRKPRPKAWSLAHCPKGTPSTGRELGFRIHSHLAGLRAPLFPTHPPPRSCYQETLPSPSHGGGGPQPLSFLSRYRHQALCTVSSRTHSFSPPTRSSQGPWATPHPRSPHALPEGSAASPSPRASSSHPGSALEPQPRHNQL